VGAEVDGWFLPGNLISLVVLVLAGVALMTHVRRSVGGSACCYAVLMAGLAFLFVAQTLDTMTQLRPTWGASVTFLGSSLPMHAGGYLLLLLGSVSVVRHVLRSQAVVRNTAETERRRADAAQLQEARLRAILNSATEYCIIGLDLEGRINLYSHGGERILGWQADEVIGCLTMAELSPWWQGAGLADVAAAIRDRGAYEKEVSLVRKDGTMFPALLTITAQTAGGPEPTGYVGVVKDITAIREAQNALRRERDFVKGILETSELAILGGRLSDGVITMFNHGAELITGYGRDEIIGREYAEILVPPDDRDRVRRAFENGREGRIPLIGRRQHTILAKGGEARAIAWTYTLLADDGGRPSQIVAFGRDVTTERRVHSRLEQAKLELEKANVELARLAATDPLTGLVNRRQADLLFDREVARARRQKSPTSVIMMDIDFFKSVNDTYGHKVGDSVLMHLADRLRSRMRTSDIVARYGGEEFLLILPDTDLDGAATVAEQMRKIIQASPFLHGQTEIPITVSCGVAVMPPDRDLANDVLVRMADNALYAAKNRGRNRVVTWKEIAEPSAPRPVAIAN
jgi:diguanylate cyclase (GGDEF)-like protein/PAS domain S-box-containing protein